MLDCLEIHWTHVNIVSSSISTYIVTELEWVNISGIRIVYIQEQLMENFMP